MRAKSLLPIILLLLLSNSLFGQSGPGDNYQGRLYRLCKVWGYVKYYHSAVSQCQVNWDSVLVATIPLVKAANDSNDFNTALLQMLNAAGPMTLATTPPPVLDSNAINVDNTWQDDSYFSDSVRAILDTIRNNFRPDSTGCQVVNNDYSNPANYGWLKFPGDSASPIIGNYPAEPTRLLLLFRHWNILKYFNAVSHVADYPWDSILLNNVLAVANAADARGLYGEFLRIFAALDDSHVQALTYSNSISFWGGYYPQIQLKYVDTSYLIIQSGYSYIQVGDIVDSFDGLSMHQWEDSLRNYLSESDSAAFRRDITDYLLRGSSNTQPNITYTDALGNKNTTAITRDQDSIAWNSFVQSGIDTVTTYTTLGCGIGYVDMNNLQPADVYNMYDSLEKLPAIIFDMRNYTLGAAFYLAALMLPDNLPAAKFLTPDITYPGNFYFAPDSFGVANNPYPYKGKVILLMNEMTRGQSEFSCMILSLNLNVLKMGSQTGGTDGNETEFNLSNDLFTGFTSLGTYYPNGNPTQRVGIIPDVVVKPTIAGVRAGKDEVLDSAIAIACKTTGIATVENNYFKLYPNPANNFITIESPANTEALQIRISNLLGQQITEATMSGNISNIDVSNFSSGLYFVSIVDTHGALVKTMKWVKE